MWITLYTETVIDSCHRLEGYNGLCKNLHGHSWLIKIWVRGDSSEKNSVGILFDFTNVKLIKEMFDHKYLNEVPILKGQNPTAENLMECIYNYLKDVDPRLEFRVRVYETAVGKKTYSEGGDF